MFLCGDIGVVFCSFLLLHIPVFLPLPIPVFLPLPITVFTGIRTLPVRAYRPGNVVDEGVSDIVQG